MADSALFDWLCHELTAVTAFSDIESRGTVRIALKKGGLAADTVTSVQLQVVIKRVLPEELRRRGCDDGQAICDGISVRLKEKNFGDAGESNSPEAVFARLGSGS